MHDKTMGDKEHNNVEDVIGVSKYHADFRNGMRRGHGHGTCAVRLRNEKWRTAKHATVA